MLLVTLLTDYMEHNIYIEFIVNLDTSIYLSSSWKTREEFFSSLIINHIDDDLKFYSNIYNKMDSAQKEKYYLFIKTVQEIKNSIQKSINYEVIDVLENIEKVKVSFSFLYFKNLIMNLEQTIDYLIFNQTIRSNTFLSTDLLIFAYGERKEPIESLCKIYAHIALFMQEAKPSLMVIQDGILMEKFLGMESKE